MTGYFHLWYTDWKNYSSDSLCSYLTHILPFYVDHVDGCMNFEPVNISEHQICTIFKSSFSIADH